MAAAQPGPWPCRAPLHHSIAIVVSAEYHPVPRQVAPHSLIVAGLAGHFPSPHQVRHIIMVSAYRPSPHQVRHPQDYGAIVLLDERHSHADAQQHLPSWLRAQGMRTQAAPVPTEAPEAAAALRDFFGQAEARYPRRR